MRFRSLIVFFPLCLVVAALAIANRQAVVFSLDPLPYEIELPLFAFLFINLGIGLGIGILAEWWRARHLRRRAKADRRRVDALQNELQHLKAERATLAMPTSEALPPAQQL